AQHHEGEEKAAGGAEARGAGRRYHAAAEDAQGRRAGQAQLRSQSGGRERARRQAQKRSEGDLMAVLVIVEHDGKLLKPGVTNTVTAATKLGGDVTALVIGK